MDEAGSGSLGLRDRCYFCTVLVSSGRVPAAATSYAAAAAGYTAAVAGHASAAASHAAAATWVYAACCDSYWGSTATAFAPAWSACHHFYDSSCIVQWALESGTATSTVCFTYRAGVLVVCLASASPAVHTSSDGLHTGSDFFAASARDYSVQEPWSFLQ